MIFIIILIIKFITIKSVLSHISEDILEMDSSSAAPADHCAEVRGKMLFTAVYC